MKLLEDKSAERLKWLRDGSELGILPPLDQVVQYNKRFETEQPTRTETWYTAIDTMETYELMRFVMSAMGEPLYGIATYAEQERRWHTWSGIVTRSIWVLMGRFIDQEHKIRRLNDKLKEQGKELSKLKREKK